MGDIPASLRRLVVTRAMNHCEYCGLSQEEQEATFHIDHIIPVAEGGPTVPENLALACVSCSLRKGARRVVVGPNSGEEAFLFNPRQEVWWDHFRWSGVILQGLTPTGRATVEALKMNRPLILAIRQQEAALGRHPWPLPPSGLPSTNGE